MVHLHFLRFKELILSEKDHGVEANFNYSRSTESPPVNDPLSIPKKLTDFERLLFPGETDSPRETSSSYRLHTHYTLSVHLKSHLDTYHLIWDQLTLMWE